MGLTAPLLMQGHCLLHLGLKGASVRQDRGLTAAPRLGPIAGLPSGLPSVAFAPMGCDFCPSTAFCPSGASLQAHDNLSSSHATHADGPAVKLEKASGVSFKLKALWKRGCHAWQLLTLADARPLTGCMHEIPDLPHLPDAKACKVLWRAVQRERAGALMT